MRPYTFIIFRVKNIMQRRVKIEHGKEQWHFCVSYQMGDKYDKEKIVYEFWYP